MKNILVPTDFSEVSKNALKFAMKIADAERATIILFHTNFPIFIADEKTDFSYDNDPQGIVMNEANAKMDLLLEYIKTHNVNCKKIIRFGLLGDAIQDLVKEIKADLIVTGMHSPKGLERLLFQTNSLNIAEKVDCPVLIIPMDSKYHGIKKIMYATDFEFGDVKELKNVCDLAKFFNANVIAIHINTQVERVKSLEEEENMEWFATITDSSIIDSKVSFRTVYNKDVNEGLQWALKFWNVDILCISTAKKSFFQKVFSKSLIKDIAYQAHIPILSLQLAEENRLG